jgi:hypothetical protein
MEEELQPIEHEIQNFLSSRDTMTVECSDGTTFDLSVGDCEKASNFIVTSGSEKVVEDGGKVTFYFTYDTQKLLAQWAHDWPG